ncbi:hypothetical protein AALB16_15750 [Lachnospiraceae bacterium 62-35]
MNDNLIDEAIRAAYGFSDKQIQAELEAAIADSNNPPELKAPEDEFQKILQKIEKLGIEPLPLERDKASFHTSKVLCEGMSNTAPISFQRPVISRKIRKVLLVTAVLSIIGIGMSLRAVGKGAMQYRVVDAGNRGTNIIWSNVKWEEQITSEEEAYTKIEETLKVPALKMGYTPLGMDFERLIIGENCGIMQFKYNKYYFYIYQLGTLSEKNGMHGSNRGIKLSEVYNPWMKKNLSIYENELEDGKKEYSVDFNYDTEAGYYINGVMDESEFIKVVKGLFIESN